MRVVRIVLGLLLALAILLATAWGALALWFRLPLPDIGRSGAALLFGLVGLGAAIALFTRHRLAGLLAFALILAVILAWWATIRPPAEADFAPDVARQVTGRIEGDRLTLSNLRHFVWRSGEDGEARWEERSYDLAKLRTLDLFMSYWGSPDIAHVMLSFGFEGGDYLAWSVEVRRPVGGAFSPVADLFKTDPLVIVAADERDVVGVRALYRGEDVQIYRMRTPPERARRLLEEYVEDANALAAKPRFYNSLTTNCTTVVVKMMRAVGAPIGFDWRLIVNGYLPDYVYDRGALDSRVTLAALKDAAHIDARAKAVGASDAFSAAIRAGVPSPLAP